MPHSARDFALPSSEKLTALSTPRHGWDVGTGVEGVQGDRHAAVMVATCADYGEASRG